jgi:predicted nuclease of predicted toxin-antitoxin system
MEAERVAHEKEEQQKTLRLKRIKDQFKEPTSQWELDKNEIHNLAAKEKAKEAAIVAKEKAKEAAIVTKDDDEVEETAKVPDT